ncbi:hypothetical protein CSTERTH_01115 [Thermoclostridium stercorarium subsp. thermolacticum DSM 2910]|uniref:BppU N-terminal domain-containing protein n=1 Tax=Thermoclostridium stercorarium subsp. thermolacticum DSM 2910 TaxID=1121336 RepID=A0A1B1YAG0_THEST|nr:BppU family phage baseplate upper protein [Thermoclostridium stercorarium]ANW97728.1 hypothetical protein CSTERTH_01115 [Thermoclostridium stercorarium subsp. thermolacticum DSM 2910]
MMILKEHNISVRLPQERAIDTGITFVQNDKGVYKLNVRVFDGDTEINYSQVSSATITFLKADGTVVQGEMQKTSNMLAYVLGTNEIAAPGKLIATIQLLGANERLTTARFLFRVEKDLITEDAVKSTSEFPILQRLVKDVEDTLPLLPEIEETIEKFPQIQEFFNTAQAAENQRISNEITRQSQESVRQAKIIEIEERFQRLTSQQQHDAEVIDARDGEISLRARLDRDRAEFESHKADIENRIDNPEYSSEQVVTGGIGNLPENLVEGQINDIIINGRTLKNEINYTPDTWEEWTQLGTGVIQNGFLVYDNNSASQYPRIQVNLRSNTKYGILLNVRENTKTAYISVYATGAFPSPMAISPSTIGNFKFIATTREDLSSANFWQADIPSGSGKIAFGDIRVFELPSGSEIESDFTNLTADQLAIKYPYIKGDSVKSVPASLKVKTVAKNLFDGKKIKYYGNGLGYVKFNEDEQKIEILRLDDGAHEGFTFDFEAQIGQIYTLSFNVISNPTSLSIAVIDPDSNVNLYSTGYFSDIGSKTLTFVATKRKLTIKSYNGTSNNSPAIIQYLQLQAGSVVTGYKEYKETVQYISAKDSQGNLIELRSLPNGVKDAINTQKNKLIKRVSNEVILHGNLEWALQSIEDKRVVVMLNVPSSGLFPNAITWNSDVTKNSTIFGYNSQDVFSSLLPAGTPRRITFREQILYIAIPIPFGTLQDAKNYLNNDPVTMYYQLETPQEINFNIEGVLQAFENGTIEITPYLKEEFSITGTSINLSKPIANLDKIEILQNGVWFETTGTLSSDGKTISVSNTGKYRVFGPIKSEESLIPEVSYTVPVNLKAQVDSNTKAITAISKSIIDLNDKVDILLILNS